MVVNVYGKLDGSCGLCESAKDKLSRMGVPFSCFELADYTEFHEGWRNDESVQVLACYSDIDTFPVITVDGKAMSYPEAMKLIKRIQKPRPVVHMQPVLEEELAAVG